jgi:uncharacterized protein (TIGR00251 family)
VVRELFDVPEPAGGVPGVGGNKTTVVLRLHVQPGAGRTSVAGVHGDALKVRVAAPPDKGRANEACRDLVASLADVKPAAVELTSGGTSRSKRFTVTDVDVEELERRLELALEEASGNARGRGSVPKSPGSR